MNITEIIDKKSLGISLTNGELFYAFNGYLKGSVPDYQMSTLLMAIKINGMDYNEIFDLTEIFLGSGEMLELEDIPNTVDKHSTGGVGDKTTLIIGPLASACGVNIPKMSGRGLGHTGGTIDKLESIPGFRTNLDKKEFIDLVKKNGFAVCSQNKSLVPMDGVIYALRDVTGTTNSIPLIAVSIMSKKIACGAQNILIDIKVGKGALIKNQKEANELSKIMVQIGNHYNRNVKTMITKMDSPLGVAIGNSLEVMEAKEILEGKRVNDLSKLCLDLASEMVSMGKKISKKMALKEVNNALNSGEAYKKFLDFVKSQGGNIDKLAISDKKQYILSIKSGTIKNIDALRFGELSLSLGAGRINKQDKINPKVGIILNKFVGDKVKTGDVLCTLYVDKDYEQSDITTYFDIR